MATPKPSRRSFWIRQITLWHWVSSGICLGATLLFTITGITLNHAAEIGAQPQVSRSQTELSPELRKVLASTKAEGKQSLPSPLSQWLAPQFALKTLPETAEWSETEIYISLPQPGGDAWISIDRESGIAKYERTDRGWISYFNDLHKGRHTGPVWQVFIDVVGVACLVFSISGLVLLQTHAAKRPSTWPLILLGLLAPVLLMLFFVHA
jgi:hypothetical protein